MSHACEGCGATYESIVEHRCYEPVGEQDHTLEQNRLAAFNETQLVSQSTATTISQTYVVVWQHTASGRLDVTLHTTEADAREYIEAFASRPDSWEPVFQEWRTL